MKSQRFLSHCISMPWAMEPGAMALYAAMLARGYALREGFGAQVSIGASREDLGQDALDSIAHARADDGPSPIEASRSRSAGARQGSIAVIQVFGAIVQRAAQLGPCEGGIGTEDIGNALQMALADETVSQILMEFDTPGGSVFGVSELGAQINAAKAQKPVVGIANSMAASAGYWLLSQCSEAYCTPGGMVGSIGVYGAHQDISKALDEEGVKITLVSAGKYKTEGSPYEPLGEEARAEMQARIDNYYSMFTKAVAKGRGVGVDQVRTGMGQGRVLQADQALTAQMIDGVATFGEVVKKMARTQQQSQRAGRSALAASRNELDLLL